VTEGWNDRIVEGWLKNRGWQDAGIVGDKRVITLDLASW